MLAVADVVACEALMSMARERLVAYVAVIQITHTHARTHTFGRTRAHVLMSPHKAQQCEYHVNAISQI
jgi:hypothetical protein